MAVKSRYRLDRRYLLIAAGVIGIVAVNLAMSMTLERSITESMLERDGLVKQEFLNGIVAAENNADKLFATPGPSPALLSFSTHVRSVPGTVRANIYSPDGFIRHSSDANLVGLHFSDNEELARSFKGKITSVMETISGSDKSEHLALNQLGGDQLIESYIPVLAPDGKVVAVVEFYRRDNWVKNTVSSIQRSIWIAAGLSSVILAAALLFAFRRSQPAKA